jgi:hypothetical protein
MDIINIIDLLNKILIMKHMTLNHVLLCMLDQMLKNQELNLILDILYI